MKFQTRIPIISSLLTLLLSKSITQCSSFTFTTKPNLRLQPFSTAVRPKVGGGTNTQLWYEQEPSENDAQRAKSAKDALDSGFWNAISYTEQWISQTLKQSSKEGTSNPYARKELIYICEMNTTPLATIAGIFRYVQYFFYKHICVYV